MPAKKHSKDELKAYFQKLATESGLPAEKTAAVLDAFDHDGFASKVDTEAIMTRADYSRVMNEEVAPAKTLYETKYQELVNTWYPGVKATHDKAVADREAADKKVKLYEKRFGSVDDAEEIGDDKVRTGSGDVIRKADFDKILAEKEVSMRAQIMGESVGLTLKIQDMAYDHYKEFGEPLDMRPLTQAVKAKRDKGDQQYDLDAAYSEQYGAKIQERRDAAAQKKIDDAVSAARVDERSKLRSTAAIVTDEDSGPFFAAQALAAKGKVLTPEELEADFVRGIREGDAAIAAAGNT